MFVLAFILSITPLQVARGGGGILYAKPAASGTGGCLSWANACTLQTALTGAVSGNEIWVMAGTHKPTTGTTCSATFQLKSGVAVYGGFAGTETARNQRDLVTNVTILSGDIDNNDSQTPIITNLTTVTGNTTNSYHVVTGATGTILDGFTITAGNANGNYPNYLGGGMFNESSSPTLANLVFSGNSAYYEGGGMYNITSSPILTNVTFSANSSNNDGGGMGNYYSSPSLTNVTFSNNSAVQNGGGMLNETGSPTLTNVTFSGNSTEGLGGGMENWNGSSSVTSNPILTNVTFSANSAWIGGGMYDANYGYGNSTLTNVTFSGNSASNDAGGMYNESSSPILTNVTFSGNSASNDAGGMYNVTSNPQIRNTIFWGNTAISGGTQMLNTNSTPILNDSVIQGGCPALSTCTNIITGNPLLGTLGNYGGFTQTIPLLAGSSAIDAGNDAICPATDQRGYTRPADGDGNGSVICDIGAYEAGSVPLPSTYTLTIASANGTVVRNPDQATYHEGDVVQLTATPNAGWSFANWTGDLTSSVSPDSVTIHGNTSVTANYTLKPYALDVSKIGTGSGTVTSSPAGIDCGATCSASYDYNTSVTITATAATGSTFTSWSGSGCSGTGTCTVTMDAAKSVTANFSLDTYRIYLPLVIR